jgi:ATP-dependent Clp protease ATP-binding subunit ClpA
MELEYDAQCRKAIDLAKQAIPEGGEIDILTLVGALYYSTELKNRVQDLTQYLEPPKIRQKHPQKRVPVEESLGTIMTELESHDAPVNAVDLFIAILSSDPGRETLIARGITEPVIENIIQSLRTQVDNWRSSSRRKEAVKALSSFGRILTENEPPHSGMIEKEEAVKELIVALMQRKKRNALIIGPPGTGKSALVYELASRIVRGDASLPNKLRDTDIFELIPSYLRAGASVVGQYDERVKALIQVLTAHPNIILFVDEIHSLFQSSTHSTGPFSDANESFKGPLGGGEITCIGCTTEGEYRHFIQPDRALERRFSVITLDPPSPETTARILKARIPKVEAYYSPLCVP